MASVATGRSALLGPAAGGPLRRALVAAVVALLLLGSASPARAWGRKINLVRRYRPGQQTVYQTDLQMASSVRSNPDILKSFLPPMPTKLAIRQQNTLTVQAIQPDGSVEIENRFDKFDFQSDLADRLPEELRDSARQAQEEFSRQLMGRSLKAHYDREGRRLGFEGFESMSQGLNSPAPEPLQQILRFFLEQVGGNSLYPDHRVRPGEEWKQQVHGQPSEAYAFSVEGETTMRYTGKTRYRGVKAVVEFRFQNLLMPALHHLRRAGPLTQLEAMGMRLDLRLEGQGEGRALLALDDGRILQNQVTLRRILRARTKGASAASAAASTAPSLEMSSETTLAVEGTRR